MIKSTLKIIFAGIFLLVVSSYVFANEETNDEEFKIEETTPAASEESIPAKETVITDTGNESIDASSPSEVTTPKSEGNDEELLSPEHSLKETTNESVEEKTYE